MGTSGMKAQPAGLLLPGARVDEDGTESTDDATTNENEFDVFVIDIVIFMPTPWIFVNQEGGV